MSINKSAGWNEFFSRLDQAALASGDMLVTLLPGGHREGREYRCGSINGGPGQSFAFNLDTGVWVDFASGERGGKGFVSLYGRIHGLKNGEAAREIARKMGMQPPSAAPAGRARKLKVVGKSGWLPVAPFADALRSEHREGVTLPAYPEEWGKPVAGWLYLDDTGRPWNYRIRFEKPGGGKDYRPLSLGKDERGQESWRWRDLPAPRILWNLEKLTRWPDKPVVVVEGEPAADAAERLLPDYVVVTWSGGATNEEHSDWKPLIRRHTPIYLWPDQDEPGKAVMLRIAMMFSPNADVRVVTPDPEWPEKTDLADLEKEGWTTDKVLTWLREHSAPAATPVTSNAERPECDLNTQDMGILQDRVWSALRKFNHKEDGPFYFYGNNSSSVRLKSIRPNVFNDWTYMHFDMDLFRAQITHDLFFFVPKWETRYPVSPKAELLAALLAKPDQETLPPLNRYVRIPVFAPDRRLIIKPGYDRLSGIYYAPPPALRGMRISEQPTAKDCQEARAVIEDMLTDFRFATAADKAAAYALMLLPIVRELIDGPTPMHRVEAPAFGTGKTIFLTIALMPTLGPEHLHFLPETHDDEEWRKVLLGVLQDDWPAILIDNVRNLDSGVLAGLMTSPLTWGGRPLHEQQPVYYKIKAVMACTVNNPVWAIEMTRRMEQIRLDAQVEYPFERTGAKEGKTWTHPAIIRYAIQNRAKILAALLTLAKYGLEHPKPFNRTKGSYEAWAQVLGPILMAIGLDDFLNRRVSEDVTVVSDGLGDLMAHFANSGEFDLDAAYSKACDLESITLNGRDDRARKTALTRLLMDCRDQVRGDFTLRYLGMRNSKKRFRIETAVKS